MSRGAGVAKLTMLTTFAMTRASFAPAEDWSETLDASTTVAYVTNPLLQAGSSFGDRTAALSMNGNTQMMTEVSQLTVTPRLAIIRYDVATNLDITTGSLALAYQEKGERDQWSVSALAQSDSTITSELGQTGISDINVRHSSYGATVGYQYLSTERLSWQVQGTGQIVRYNDAAEYGLIGYSYDGAQFGPTWSLSDRLQGSLSVETDHVSAQNGTSEKDYSANVQLARSLSEQYSWRASVGATQTVIPGAPGAPTSGVFEVGASRQGERVQWDLSARRAVLPIGLGLLARQEVAALSAGIRLSERSTLNLSCNVIRSQPVSLTLYFAPGVSLNYQVYNGATWGQATGEWLHHFSPTWGISAAYTQSRARNYSLSEWANGSQARLTLLWQGVHL